MAKQRHERHADAQPVFWKDGVVKLFRRKRCNAARFKAGVAGEAESSQRGCVHCQMIGVPVSADGVKCDYNLRTQLADQLHQLADDLCLRCGSQ